MLADAVGDATGPWWIIGSAAVALHRAPVGEVRDVDLLMEVADARRILNQLGVPSEPDRDHPRFRSQVFGTWREPPLAVEIFAGFSLAATGGWRPIVLRTREAIDVGDRIVYLPSRSELRGLLEAFGRPKDLERARLLA